MQKKINRAITIIVSVTIIVISIISVIAVTKIYIGESKQNIENIARLCAETGNSPQKMAEYVSSLGEDIRVTYVKKDGTVAFDSEGNESTMENHANRVEIKKALSGSEGRSTRNSETLRKSTYYYALPYGDGAIRFSAPISNLYSILVVVVPIFIYACVILLIITSFISHRISKSFMKPIKKIVDSLDVKDGLLAGGDLDVEYEELKPIVSSIAYTSARLEKYIARLKREKARVTLITDNMVEGMILLDGEGEILSVNRSAAAILNPGYEKGENDTLTDLTDNDRIISMMHSLKSENTAYDVININDRFYRVYMNRSEYAGNYGVIILLIDATESVTSEQIRHEFSANVTHELKTPLTTIKGFGEMLETGIITSPDDVKKYGGIIYREGERLLQLINDIIRLSEIEEKTCEMETMSMGEVCSEVTELLSHKAQTHNVQIISDVENIKIVANRGYISELLINLIDNAIKYNTENGWVRLTVKDVGSRALISVEDNGIGIPKESQSRIFERFYRVDKSRSKQTGGTGLGLSIVKHIVTYHGGSISLKSDLCVGTKIVITIPKIQQ